MTISRQQWYEARVGDLDQVVVKGDTLHTLRNNLYHWRNLFREAAEEADRMLEEQEKKCSCGRALHGYRSYAKGAGLCRYCDGTAE